MSRIDIPRHIVAVHAAEPRETAEYARLLVDCGYDILDMAPTDEAWAGADLLLVDPPRVGLESRVRETIAERGPAAVVYVSCDPATLARDLKLLAARGYRLESVLAFDLFPQTPHVETVVRLAR